MARRRSPQRFEHAKLKCAVFLAFSLALFTGMYFLWGKLDREWRGVIEIDVLFSQVTKIHTLAPVLYNGMEMGRVKAVKVVHATPELLKKLPKFTNRDLAYLPLSDTERGEITHKNPNDPDAPARKFIENRPMIMATLTLLIEQDEHRLRSDDRYFASSGYLGESSIEIVTGNAELIPPRSGLVFLGAKLDLMTDIGKMLEDFSGWTGELVKALAGRENEEKIHGQIRNIDDITKTIESKTKELMKDMIEAWNSIDAHGADADKRLAELMDSILREDKDNLGLKPRVEAAVKDTSAKIASMHASLGKSTSDADAWLADYRKQIVSQVREFRKIAADYKVSTPERLKEFRGHTDSALSAALKLETTLDQIENQLKESTENARIYTGAQVNTAMNIQETVWHFKESPTSLNAKATVEQLNEKHRAWRYDMVRKQYQEIRRELAAMQGEMGVADPADRERARHVEQLLTESDAFFGINRGDFPVIKSNVTPGTEIRTGEPVPVPPPAEVFDLSKPKDGKKGTK